MKNRERLVVFSDDWGRHPSSCQHLVKRFLSTHDVIWVNTIGMRPPRLDRLTFKRGFEKLKGWVTPQLKPDQDANGNTVDSEPHPSVFDTKMWPWMSSGFHRNVNRRLLTRQLHELTRNATVVTTLPIVVDLVGEIPASKWIYYCVDDFSVWPGLSGDMLRSMEDELLPKMDQVVVVSETLSNSIANRGIDSQMLTHGVDLEFWQHEPVAATTPLVLFWGVIDRRMNADWVISLASAMKEGVVRLVGPHQDPDPRLFMHERIEMPGPVDLLDLPQLASSAAVLVMPYADLPVTRAMQPLKLKEYLATGKPIVVSNLPATRAWGEFLKVTQSEEQFVSCVLASLQEHDASLVDQGELRRRLSRESWDAKALEFEKMIWGVQAQT